MKWPMVPLPKVAIINPRRPRDIKLRDDDPVTFAPMPAVSEVTASIETPEIRPFGEVKKGFTYFEEGDVLFAKITPCMENGKSAIATDLCNGVGFGSTEFHVLRAKDNLLIPTFLHYFIRQQSFRNAAKSRMRGAAGQQRVPKDFLNEVLVPLPPLSEQRRIMEILDQADALRKKRAEADAKAARILPALFYKMFGDPATNPKGFPVETLSKVTCIIHRYPTFYGVDYVSNGVPVVRISDIKDNHILNGCMDDYVKVPKEFSDRFPLTVLEPYDIVMAVRGDTTGKIGLVPPELSGANISPNLIRIRPDRQRIRPLYLFCYLLVCSKIFRRFITDTAKKSITAKNLKTIPVLIPDLDTQEHFERMINSILAIEESRMHVTRSLEILFRVFLHRAFTGDLTACWRGAHMKELLEEMEQQAKALEAQSGNSKPAEIKSRRQVKRRSRRSKETLR